jgi:hypothetical protein
VTEELLADSFMRVLFARFYEMLRANSASVRPELQVGATPQNTLVAVAS